MAKNHKYRLGDYWREDFDYCGMLAAGRKAKVTDSPKKLEKLFRSYESVNYHRESGPLWDAIQLLKDRSKAAKDIKEFKRMSASTYKEICRRTRKKG